MGDAEQLPLTARSVDGYTIAFGIRNVTRIDAALAEAHRVRCSTCPYLCLTGHPRWDHQRTSASFLPWHPCRAACNARSAAVQGG